jgi:hypothetical protein
MNFKLTNHPDDDLLGRHEVRLTIETDHMAALDLLELAFDYERNRPDPILQALRQATGTV